MSMTFKFGAALTALLLASTANAQTTATASVDLNMRSGPGVAYDIVGVIPASKEATVEGCLAQSNWCRVGYDGVSGWSSGDYLTAMVAAPIYTNRERLSISTVTHDNKAEAAVGAGAAGAIAGALIAGPVGALIGATIGAGMGATAAPEERVTTYVTQNPVAPIYLDGEVVVGAGIPEVVELSEVPESDYYYGYINGTRVLVDRKDRRIVHIVR